jgi:hypothetical protein
MMKRGSVKKERKERKGKKEGRERLEKDRASLIRSRRAGAPQIPANFQPE